MIRPLLAIGVALTFAGCAGTVDFVPVTALVETDPVKTAGDAADDPAIWVHPTDPDKSVIIATDKRRGLEVYGLTGKRIADLPTAALNNVDIRQNVDSPNGRSMDLIVASDTTSNAVVLFSMEPDSRTPYALPIRANMVGGASIYGICIGRIQGQPTIFALSREGIIAQYRFDFSGLQVERQFSVPSTAEGCVVDDATGVVFVAEETAGIWRFEPNEDNGTLIAPVDGNHLAADIEGLALAGDFLVASSQGNSRFAVLQRQPPHRVLGSFSIDDGRIDGVQETDGIAASTFSSSAFPRGLLVVQDGVNTDPTAHQNFKLVELGQILDHFSR